jgi:ADP-ribosylglycohydrolase
MNPGAIQLRDQILRCLLGGAVGDALGAPFEGLWADSIRHPQCYKRRPAQ